MTTDDPTLAAWWPTSPAAQALAHTLLARYPAAFPTADAAVRPLKRDIFCDIQQACGVPHAVVREVLHAYRQRPAYLAALAVPGALRIDLAGQPVAPVTRADHQRQRRLAARRQHTAALVAAGRVASPAMAAAGRRLGLACLYPLQIQTITAVLAGQDVLLVQPTGFGKSACYQVPVLLLPRPVVVISPLLALLRDQEAKLLAYRVPVVRLDSTVRAAERRAALQRLVAGGSFLVLTTPETLLGDELGAALRVSGLALAAVDEAHSLSEWGHDFRPAYRRLGPRLRDLGAPPLLALTATATSPVREDIVEALGMRQPLVLARSPHRANLALAVQPCAGDDRVRTLVRLARRCRRPGILYCATTTAVDALSGALQRLGLPVCRYHGRMRAADRLAAQQQFLAPGRRTLMVATSAFGLGIDKPDIRFVVHCQAPASLEQYVQEVGRAGRDGQPAQGVLLYDPADRLIHAALQQRSRVHPAHLRRVLAVLTAWADEGRSSEPGAVAVAAQGSLRQTHAVLAVLAAAGLVTWDAGRCQLLGAPAIWGEKAQRLAQRFTTLRVQDGRRWEALAAYATGPVCRATAIRHYFGEETARSCGICDACRGLRSSRGADGPLAVRAEG